MKAGAFSDAGVAELSKSFVAVYVDTSKDTSMLGTYGVTMIPDVRFLKPDGSQIGRLGPRDAAAVAQQMQAALDTVK